MRVLYVVHVDLFVCCAFIYYTVSINIVGMLHLKVRSCHKGLNIFFSNIL